MKLQGCILAPRIIPGLDFTRFGHIPDRVWVALPALAVLLRSGAYIFGKHIFFMCYFDSAYIFGKPIFFMCWFDKHVDPAKHGIEAKSATLRAAPGVLSPTAFYACINILLFLP